MAETVKTTDSEKLMTEHIDVLRGYAKRVVAHGWILTRDEERDKTARMAEYMEQGRSAGLSDSDLYSQIFGDMVEKAESKCGCPTCRKRAARERNAASGGGMASSAT
jgi:Uri superfamily endonuclease